MLDTLWQQIAAIALIDWIAMFAGVIGVTLSIQERVAAWPLFIICYLAYIYISFRSGFYAFAVLNIGFVGVAVYGWCKWSGRMNHTEAGDSHLRISALPVQQRPLAIVFVVACTLIVGYLLSQMATANAPYTDAFAMGNALVAQWLLSRKHIENWLFWIISDVVYLYLFLKDGVWPSVVLFCIFIILACKGWRDWRRSIARDALTHGS